MRRRTLVTARCRPLETVGEPFAITTAGIWFDGIKPLAFGSGRYLVTYTRLIVPARGAESDNRYIAGRILQPGGALGEEFRISTGFGKASDVTFDGTNYLVVWNEEVGGMETGTWDSFGQLVSPAGTDRSALGSKRSTRV